MAHNDCHPMLRRDEALIVEFNAWYERSAEMLPNIHKKREMLGYLDSANTMARNVKHQIATELDEMDKGAGIKPDSAPPGTLSDSYYTKRTHIFGRYATVNDRIWDRRAQLGNQLDTMLSRINNGAGGPRDRMPKHIVMAAKISPEQQKAASAYDRLTTSTDVPAPTNALSDYERQRA